MKKRLFILFALALVLCAGMSMLCTSCATDSTAESNLIYSEAESELPQREPIPTPTATPVPQGTETPALETPDLLGVVQEVGQESITVMPIRVQTANHESVAAAGAEPTEEITVQIGSAVLQSVTVFNGGSGKLQTVDMSALKPDVSVYLYGDETADGFIAEKVLILKTEADAS